MAPLRLHSRLMAAAAAADQQDLLLTSRDEHSGLGRVHSANPPPEATLRPQRRIVVGLAESPRPDAGTAIGTNSRPGLDDLWAGLTTDRQGCSGNRCPDFARCPFQAARQRAKRTW